MVFRWARTAIDMEIERPMNDPDRIPDEAFVVRCGLPPFENSPLIKGCRRHPEGPYGFSVQSEVGLTVERLAAACRNGSVGYTTAGEIRRMGYDVIRTHGDFHHATVLVPKPWNIRDSEDLTAIFRIARNPSPRKP